MKKLINTSMIYFILAMVAGVFYREFTKLQQFTEQTTLSVLHTHLLILGMVMFLIIAIFGHLNHQFIEEKNFKRFYVLYNIALPLMTIMMLVRGIFQVLNTPLTLAMNASISGIAGVSHILITIAFFMLFSALKKSFVK